MQRQGIGFHVQTLRLAQAPLPFQPDLSGRVTELRSKHLCILCGIRWKQGGDRCATCKDLDAPVHPVKREKRKPTEPHAHPVRYSVYLEPRGSIAMSLVHRSRVIAPLGYLGS